MVSKPFSQACENNKQPILDALATLLTESGRLLELGSGTGQHALFFSTQLPAIRWQPSDLADALPGICAWLDGAKPRNCKSPIVLDVSGRWPDEQYRYLFTANTFHIMSADLVSLAIEKGAAQLLDNGLYLVYGPVNRDGQFTADSNRQFDQWLKQRSPLSGIRNLEWIQKQMATAGLQLHRDVPMPANNCLLAFRKTATATTDAS